MVELRNEVFSEAFQNVLAVTIPFNKYTLDTEGHYSKPVKSSQPPDIMLFTLCSICTCTFVTCVRTALWYLWWLTNLSNVPALNFTWISANILPRPSKCFFKQHSFNTAYQVPVKCLFKMASVQGDQLPAKCQKILKKKCCELIHEDYCRQEIPMETWTCTAFLNLDTQSKAADSLYVPWVSWDG